MRRALRTFELHPECVSCGQLAINNHGATAELRLNIEMPLKWRARGHSPNGVQREEVVTVQFAPDYPWSAPRFSLRADFDRQLPHIQPGLADQPPEPCLVYGSLNEYFLEVGLLSLVDQLCLWLERAAKGSLINEAQGWEPIVRNRLHGELIMDASFIRGLVDRRGGCTILGAQILRSGPKEGGLGVDVSVFGKIYSDRLPLNHSKRSPLVGLEQLDANHTSSLGPAMIVWPGRNPDGTPIVASKYFPETVETLEDLLNRAKELQCLGSLQTSLKRLDQVLREHVLSVAVTIPVVLCVRRPFALIDTDTTIELLPYAFDLRLESGRGPFLEQRELTVIPVSQLDALTPHLFQSTSRAPETPPAAVLGAGSVGSKVALHLARNGAQVLTVADYAWLRPHNLARHGLASTPHGGKATELAKALGSLGQATEACEVNILSALADTAERRRLIPKEAKLIVDTTASLQIRSRLSALKRGENDPRQAAIALFGEGDGAYLMIEGTDGGPTLEDLSNFFYAELVANDTLREIATANDGELRHVATGQGCGTMTMRMTDTRVSAMTAIATEQLVSEIGEPKETGLLLYGVRPRGAIEAQWKRIEVVAPTRVDIDGSGGWQFRLSAQALKAIRADIAAYPTVETGGILVGRSNERLRTVSVMDVLPAPPKSERSATGFILGTDGGEEAIRRFHDRSGRTLWDVGTWHSHLANEPPSPRDKTTAKKLAGERPPPFALLVVTPERLFGLMHAD